MAERMDIDEASCLRESVKTIPRRDHAFGPHYCPNSEESEDPANHLHKPLLKLCSGSLN